MSSACSCTADPAATRGEVSACAGTSATTSPAPTLAAAAAVRRLELRSFLAAVTLWVIGYAAADPLSRWFTHEILGLAPGTRVASTVAFFVFEVPRVLLLLVGVVFVVGVVNSYFTAERTRRLLVGRREAVGNVLAALLGVVTPFCSCSAVPLFIAFVEAGIPLGVTFSFLVSAPMVNEVALVLLFGLFGWRIALVYLATGLAIAILSGIVLGRLRMEAHIEAWVREQRARPQAERERPTLAERGAMGVDSVRKVVGKTWPFVFVGIGVGAVIHGWVPEGVLAGVMGKQAWWSVPLAVGIGVPMYAGTATLIPIVQALLAKGAALGTVLAFMMAVVGLSLPEFILLRRVLRPRLLGAFIGVVSTGILLVGWLFNALL